jgi:hypothetical protein
MGFFRPNVPAPAPAPPPPVIEDTAAKAQEQADLLRQRRGRASSILTQKPGAGGMQAPVTSAKELLGS